MNKADRLPVCDLCFYGADEAQDNGGRIAVYRVIDRAADPEGETPLMVCEKHYREVYEGTKCEVMKL